MESMCYIGLGVLRKLSILSENGRGGASESSGILKTHNLLNFETPKNAESGKIVPCWDV
jgi:hypothetical protein